MGILNFLVVIAFNLWWLKDHNLSRYKQIYTGGYGLFFAIAVWAYAIWGILNLIYALS